MKNELFDEIGLKLEKLLFAHPNSADFFALLDAALSDVKVLERELLAANQRIQYWKQHFGNVSDESEAWKACYYAMQKQLCATQDELNATAGDREQKNKKQIETLQAENVSLKNKLREISKLTGE